LLGWYVRFTVTPVVFEMRRLYIVRPAQRQVRAALSVMFYRSEPIILTANIML
jgi:hypothetical protein